MGPVDKPEVKAYREERHRQLNEARRVLGLAWSSGMFDDLDPPASPWTSTRDRIFVTNSTMLPRVVSRAMELLAGQYPEVRVKARPRARGWSDERPRARLDISLRMKDRRKK